MTLDAASLPAVDLEDQIQVSEDGSTVWVHAMDGSTVGRFSKHFGIDVHRTMTDQLAGAGQCLSCTHEPPTAADWTRFVELMQQHHEVTVPEDLITFRPEPGLTRRRH